MPNSTVWSPRHSALQSLLNALSAATAPVYVVGGVVRDHLLGLRKSTNDMDVVVEHSALLVARQVADKLGWAFYPDGSRARRSPARIYGHDAAIGMRYCRHARRDNRARPAGA